MGFSDLVQVRVGYSPVGVSLGKLRVEPYGLAVVVDGSPDLAQSMISATPVVVDRSKARVNADRLIKVFYGLL